MKWWPTHLRGGEPFQAVPRLDLLDEGSRTGSARIIARGVLALLLVAGVLLLQGLYRTGITMQQKVDSVEAEVASTSEELGAAQQQVEELRVRLQGLKEQEVEGKEEAAKLEWAPALAALRGLQGDGVTFQTLDGDAGGTVTLVAAASSGEPLARFQERLQAAGLPLELRNVRWQRRGTGTVLTVTLRLRGAT